MYGTRDAALNWEETYCEFMIKSGFTRGRCNPCLFKNVNLGMMAVIHGDDFTLAGCDKSLDKFRSMIKERFEVQFRARLGPDKDDDKMIRVLNRIITWERDRITYEADPRHVEITIDQLGLKEAKPVNTPATKTEDDDTLLEGEQCSVYRAIVARLNYLAQDRSDIAYAVKEACRGMSSPSVGNWTMLKRIGRYLLGKPRVTINFDSQDRAFIEVWTDTDYAGCQKTRRSTSGGVLRIGKHMIKSWSTTQATIALSSGEAE
jgi:hypothetical protein